MSTRAELHLREALSVDPSPEMKRRIEKLLKAIEDRRHTSAEHRELDLRIVRENAQSHGRRSNHRRGPSAPRAEVSDMPMSLNNQAAGLKNPAVPVRKEVSAAWKRPERS